ncbi:hypothetical protein [Pseudomonas sp. R1-15]|uniref:hypothetical protein n=1 Tax=Pseudomonas sp. R1-15 TaxID=2817399 RepID=UPI003DA92CF5
MANDREIVLEQAIVALLCEAKEAGVDLVDIAEKAKTGVLENKPYTWVGPDHKTGVRDAIDYLLTRFS